MSKYTVYSDQVTINAPIALVWDVLLDFEAYPKWNPFTFQVHTDLVIGHDVELHVAMPGRKQRVQVEQLRELSKPHCLSWGMVMGSALLLDALRQQMLTAIDEHSCCYQTTDAFAGLLTPLVVKFYGEPIRQGFNVMAYALKKRAESIHKQQAILQTGACASEAEALS